MFKRLLSVGGFTLLSRITGFARDILMAWIIGKNFLSDALIVAFMFPNYFRAIFGEGAINPAFLPRYATLHARGDHAAAARFADQIFSWQILAQLVILVGGLIAMPLLLHIIAPGFAFNPEQMAVTVSLARITFPYLIMTLVAIQLSAMLNAIERFWAAAAWSNFQNLGMIATLICWRWFPNGAYAAAWGMLAGGVMQLFFMLWAAQRDGLNLRIVRPRWTPNVAEFFKALGAVTLGTATTLIAPMIDTVLASFLAEGSRTALYYGDRINQLPLGVLGIALGTVLLPEMSSRLARNDRAGSDSAQNNAAALTLLLTLPFAVAFFTIPRTIMTAIFAHGAFDAHAAALAGTALAGYGIGLPAFALVRIFASSFYARHDTGTPARITFIAFGANIAMKVALVWGLHLGIAGIALGTAFGAWLNVGQLIWVAHRRGLLVIGEGFRRAIGPILLAGAGAGVGGYGGVWLVAHAGVGGRWQDVVALVAAGVLGGLLYVTIVLLFRRSLPLGRLAGKAS